MKIAVISDVHGNAFALQKVISEIEHFAPDVLLNLGDMVYGSANPAEAWRLLEHLRAQYTTHEVRGNTDQDYAEQDRSKEKDPMLTWLNGQLPEQVKEHFSNLPTTFSLMEGEILVAHGNLRTPYKALLLEKETKWASNKRIKNRLGDIKAKVVLVGHTHVEHLRKIGTTTVVNVGSISRQKDGDPAARWLSLDNPGGHWQVVFHRVPYDTEQAARWVEEHAPSSREAEQLRTGTVKKPSPV